MLISRPGASQLEAPSLEINIFKENEAARLEIDISSRIHQGQISFRYLGSSDCEI